MTQPAHFHSRTKEPPPAAEVALREVYDKLCLIVGGLAYDDASAAALFQAIDDLNDVCEIARRGLETSRP